MVVYSRNDQLLCLTFSSTLKNVASDWFNSSSSRSLHNFEEVTEAFLTQYAPLREAKKSNHHLLSVKIRQRDNLKSYTSFFQSQLTRSLTAVRMSLHSHSLTSCMFFTPYTNTSSSTIYQMREILSRAQPASSWRRQWRFLSTVRILPYFQEEMMVQEDSIKVGEDDGWSRRKVDQSMLVDYVVDKTISRLIRGICWLMGGNREEAIYSSRLYECDRARPAHRKT